MGLFNDTTVLDSYAINIYCIVSALFFAACGYAQLNDPNPLPWFGAYVFGGTIPNLYWMTMMNNSSAIGNNNSNTTTGTTLTTKKLQFVLHGYIIIIGFCILYKIMTVAPKLFDEMIEHHYGFLWAFMEHEEGRDSCGLFLLIVHVGYMNYMLSPSSSRDNQRRKSSNSDALSSTSSSFSSVSNGLNIVLSSPTILSFFLLCVLGICIYVWVVHHPEMVAKYGVPHCQGSMFGRDDNNEL